MKYEAKVNYIRLDETSGKEKKVTESYIIRDAETWADAEEQLYTQMAKITSAQVTKAIKLSDVVDIIGSEGDWFYKAKIGFEIIDELSGKSKMQKETILVRASGFLDAHSTLQDYVAEIVVPAEVFALSKSSIVDIFDDNFIPSVKIVEEYDESDD